MKPAFLVLEDGEVFEGAAFGATDETFGEVVFNTSMTGYQEVLTDPSYEGQIVVMTYPHIGNYGINDEDAESRRIWVRGFVTRDLPSKWSSWRGQTGLDDYLTAQGISGITEVDTRRLTRHIRERGAMRGAISTADPSTVLVKVAESPGMTGANLVDLVSTREPYAWNNAGEPGEDGPHAGAPFKVAAYDFGIKHNILRLLALQGCSVTVYPASTPASEVLRERPDGVFFSNGPGDPEAVAAGVEAVGGLIGKVPVFGICLGHQLMALAAGLRTYKLRFGHRGINHPVARLRDGAIAITTQNHGFAVAEEEFGFARPSRPGEPLLPYAPGEPPAPMPTADTRFGPAELTHLNLNDYTVEGFRFLDEPAFAIQYHPEAGPGPHDSNYLFEDFRRLMEENR